MAVHQRIFALSGAVLFLVSSLGLSFLVIWQLHKDSQSKKQQDAVQKALSTLNQSSTKPQEGKLAGTKLTNFTPVSAVDSLQSIDISVGTGDVVKAGDTVTAHYTGATAKDGVIFESSHDSGQPATFPLSQVIQGWQQGVPGMKVGGVRRLLIPASLAYGEQGSPPKIGPNEPLVFDIELVSIGK